MGWLPAHGGQRTRPRLNRADLLDDRARRTGDSEPKTADLGSKSPVRGKPGQAAGRPNRFRGSASGHSEVVVRRHRLAREDLLPQVTQGPVALAQIRDLDVGSQHRLGTRAVPHPQRRRARQ